MSTYLNSRFFSSRIKNIIQFIDGEISKFKNLSNSFIYTPTIVSFFDTLKIFTCFIVTYIIFQGVVDVYNEYCYSVYKETESS